MAALSEDDDEEEPVQMTSESDLFMFWSIISHESVHFLKLRKISV